MRGKLIGTRQVVERLGCSRTYANDLLHMFGNRGQMYWIGKRMKVEQAVFEEWLEQECRTKVGRLF